MDADVRKELSAIKDIAVRIDERTQLFSASIKDHEKRLRVVEVTTPQVVNCRDHEDRLRTLERRRWFAEGAIAVIGSLATLFGAKLLGWLK
jgi:hypothetical protein